MYVSRHKNTDVSSNAKSTDSESPKTYFQQASPVLFSIQISFPKMKIWLLSYTYLKPLSRPPTPARTQLHNRPPWPSPPCISLLLRHLFSPLCSSHRTTPRHPDMTGSDCFTSPATCVPLLRWSPHQPLHLMNIFQDQSHQLLLWEALDFSIWTGHLCVPIAPQTNVQ